MPRPRRHPVLLTAGAAAADQVAVTKAGTRPRAGFCYARWLGVATFSAFSSVCLCVAVAVAVGLVLGHACITAARAWTACTRWRMRMRMACVVVAYNTSSRLCLACVRTWAEILWCGRGPQLPRPHSRVYIPSRATVPQVPAVLYLARQSFRGQGDPSFSRGQGDT